MPNYTTNFKPNYLLVKLCVSAQCWVHGTSVINSVPFRPEWPENTVPASKPEWYNPLFHLGTNSGSFRDVPAVLGNTGRNYGFGRNEFHVKKNWQNTRKNLISHDEGGKIKGRMGRWEEKNQEKKTKGKRR